MNHPLNNKVVLITGSSMGIGFSTAKLCLSLGAKVMLHGRHEGHVNDAKARLNAPDEQLGSCIADFTLKSPSAPQILVSETLKKFGRVDCLINNAGIYPRNTIDDLDDELFWKVMKVNLKPLCF